MHRSITLKDYLCYQQHGSVSCEVFPSKHSRSYTATWSGKALTSIIYYAYLIFSMKTTGHAQPEAVNVGKRETWQHKSFGFLVSAYTGKHWL